MVILQEKKQYQQQQFASEKIAVAEVASAEEFGHFIALDLLSWIEQNPEGVIALPTGRTPESFIRALEWYKKSWNDPVAEQNRMLWGIRSSQFPNTKKLRFVQIDEFLWMSHKEPKSYLNYISQYYLSVLEIDNENCLFMDFSQMGFDLDCVRAIIDQQSGYDLAIDHEYVQIALQKVQTFCRAYEQKIQEWGGIGYFLGGIGLDGHIAFNISGSSPDSATRIVELNRESKKGFSHQNCYFNYAVTIGLKTIIQNPETRIVLGALGKSKADIVQKIVEGTVDKAIPASILQNHTNSLLVASCASTGLLQQRRMSSFARSVLSADIIERIIIQSALRVKKRIIDLVYEDFDVQSRVLIDRIKDDLQDCLVIVIDRLKAKIDRGLQRWTHKTVLHTAPHHDDIMLGYYPVIKNQAATHHEMMYIVSGSNGISDEYLYRDLKQMGVHQELVDLYEKQGDFVGNKVAQSLKMRIREQEAEQLWKLSDVKCGVSHMRSPFYNASFFKSQPTYDQDVAPCVEKVSKINPGLILVLNDSEFQGPNTHHLSKQVVLDAINAYSEDCSVWGYRNVWDRYELHEAAIAIPVSQKEYDDQHEAFISCFVSQRKALYPSKNGSEPFTVYAQQLQKEQYQQVVTLLGQDYFENHRDEKVRSAVGLVLFEEIKIRSPQKGDLMIR